MTRDRDVTRDEHGTLERIRTPGRLLDDDAYRLVRWQCPGGPVEGSACLVQVRTAGGLGVYALITDHVRAHGWSTVRYPIGIYERKRRWWQRQVAQIYQCDGCMQKFLRFDQIWTHRCEGRT